MVHDPLLTVFQVSTEEWTKDWTQVFKEETLVKLFGQAVITRWATDVQQTLTDDKLRNPDQQREVLLRTYLRNRGCENCNEPSEDCTNIWNFSEVCKVRLYLWDRFVLT